MTNYTSKDKSPLPTRQILAQRIRVLRLMRRWSQETLAELANLHRTYIGALERAERNPCLDNIEKIARALEVPVRQLLDERLDAWFGHDRVEQVRAVYDIDTPLALPQGVLQQAA